MEGHTDIDNWLDLFQADWKGSVFVWVMDDMCLSEPGVGLSPVKIVYEGILDVFNPTLVNWRRIQEDEVHYVSGL